MLTGVAPILLVKNVVASAEYWRDKVGFEFELYGEPPNFCILQRDSFRLMLAQTSPDANITPNWRIVDKTSNVYFWTDNADRLYSELQERGATIDWTIYDTPWGCREFGIQDLDDHDIAFGQVLNQSRSGA